MEDILRKREINLIKEGLNFINSFEKYIIKNKPNIYKKYLDIKEKKLQDEEVVEDIQLFKEIKSEANSFNFGFQIFFIDIFNEMEDYIKISKKKVLLKRENLNKICDNLKIINEINRLKNPLRFNYVSKCENFLYIKSLIEIRYKS